LCRRAVPSIKPAIGAAEAQRWASTFLFAILNALLHASFFSALFPFWRPQIHFSTAQILFWRPRYLVSAAQIPFRQPRYLVSAAHYLFRQLKFVSGNRQFISGDLDL
jgi:hypothetical protein